MKSFQFYFKICKGLLFVSILLISINSNAQIMRGTSVISGDLYARYQTNEVTNGDEKDLEFEIIPSFGYFLADNFSLNVAIGGRYTSSTIPQFTGEDKYETLYYYFEPSVKLYKAVTDKFYFNLQFFFLYGLRDNKYTSYLGNENKTSFADIAVGARPGITYFVTDKIAFTSTLGTIGYSMSKNKDTDLKSGTILTSFGLNSLFFGISFYMPKKI